MMAPGVTYNPTTPPPDITAAISSFNPNAKKSSLRTRLFAGKTDQEMIRRYDEQGPGAVGYYLDLKAAMVSMMRWQIQKWDPDTYSWVAAEEPLPQTAWNKQFVGSRNQTAKQMIFELARDVEAIGEVGLAKIRTETGSRFEVVALDAGSYEVLSRKTDPVQVVGFRKTKGSTKPRTIEKAKEDPDWIVVNEPDLHRVYRRHPRWSGEAYSPIMRSLSEIRRYDNATRALHRATASQLALSRILWIEGTQKEYGTFRNGKTEWGPLGKQINRMLEYGERSITDYGEEQVSSAMPYPFVSEKEPKPVDLVQVVDPLLIELKQDAVKDLARSWNIPHSIITEGQGSATRMLNEVLQDEAFKETSIMPLAQLIADAITAVFLAPWISDANEEYDNINLDPATYRIWPVSESETGPAPEDVKWMAELGIITPKHVSELMNVEAGLLKRPPEVTDWDWWQTLKGNETLDQTQDEEDPQIAASLNQDWISQPYGDNR